MNVTNIRLATGIGSRHFVPAAAARSSRNCADATRQIIAPEDIAALMHFLAADDCPMISGQALSVDAGAHAGFSLAAVSALADAAEAAGVTDGVRGAWSAAEDLEFEQ